MEEEVKKYLDSNGRRIIEEWCSLQKDTLLRQLIGFMAQEKWEAEHGIKKEEAEAEAEEAEEVEEEDLPPREREDAMDGEVIIEAEHWVGESTGVTMTVKEIPTEPPKLVRQDAEDVPHVKTCIGKAL